MSRRDDAGLCADESAKDPSVATSYNATTRTWTRRIKHFSGYTVVANRTTTRTY